MTPEKIRLIIRYYDRVFIPILADLLPDKINEYYGKVQILRYFIGRQSIMDFVNIFENRDLSKIGNSTEYFF